MKNTYFPELILSAVERFKKTGKTNWTLQDETQDAEGEHPSQQTAFSGSDPIFDHVRRFENEI